MTPESALRGGLRARILLIALIILVIATAGAIATAGYLFNERLTQAQIARAGAVAKSLDVQLQRLLALGIVLEQLQGFEEQCRDAVRNNDGLSQALVVRPDGHILFHSDAAVHTSDRVSDGLFAAVDNYRTIYRDDVQQTVFSILPVQAVNGTTVAYIAVGFPYSLIEAQRNSLITASLTVSAVAIGVGMLLLLFALSRYVLRPISTLVASMAKLRTSGEAVPGQRLPETDLLEFGIMAQGVNRLLDRVEAHEQALRQAKDVAVSASRAKTAFLANMSHELRTPMNAIMGFTDLALRRSQDDETRVYLERMRTAENNLLGIINDVLDLSRIEAERVSLEIVPFKVPRVIEQHVALLERGAHDKGLDIRIEIDTEVAERTFMGDPQRLGQVILNLAGNAVKFTEHGWICIRARKLNRSNGAAFELEFEVEDTGIGIAPEHHERLFQSFEQVDNSSTRRFGGTGLGLAISRRLVELMHGRIGVRSEPGKGSVFWFTVGLTATGANRIEPDNLVASEETVQMLRSAVGDRHVLVVEDDPINQLVVMELLADAGLDCDLASDGSEALHKVDPARHAMVLMDLQMPGMNGLTATVEMRKHRTLRSLPIVAMTANVFDSDRERCRQVGMNGFIAKPVTSATLYFNMLQAFGTVQTSVA